MTTFMQSTDVTSIGSVGVHVLPPRKGRVVLAAPRLGATHGISLSASGLNTSGMFYAQPVTIPVDNGTGVQPRGVPV